MLVAIESKKWLIESSDCNWNLKIIKLQNSWFGNHLSIGNKTSTDRIGTSSKKETKYYNFNNHE